MHLLDVLEKCGITNFDVIKNYEKTFAHDMFKLNPCNEKNSALINPAE